MIMATNINTTTRTTIKETSTSFDLTTVLLLFVLLPFWSFLGFFRSFADAFSLA